MHSVVNNYVSLWFIIWFQLSKWLTLSFYGGLWRVTHSKRKEIHFPIVREKKKKSWKENSHCVLVKWGVLCLKISKSYVSEFLACRNTLEYGKSLHFGFSYYNTLLQEHTLKYVSLTFLLKIKKRKLPKGYQTNGDNRLTSKELLSVSCKRKGNL